VDATFVLKVLSGCHHCVAPVAVGAGLCVHVYIVTQKLQNTSQKTEKSQSPFGNRDSVNQTAMYPRWNQIFFIAGEGRLFLLAAASVLCSVRKYSVGAAEVE
jgi:hypothetical protein